MRMERLIVPVLSVLALGWAVVQTMAGLLFERELIRAMTDLQARGELSIQRTDVSRGWLASRGILHISPLLDDSWHLDVTYRARHGVFDTDLDGTLHGHLDDGLDSMANTSGHAPRWKARYHMLSATFDGALELSPMELRQRNRSLELKGGRVAFRGGFGDWQVRARLESARLNDGDRSLEAGPIILESRYAYTQGAYHFTQDDQLRIANLRWLSSGLTLAGDETILTSHTVLDERELRVRSELDLGRIYTAGEVLLSGSMSLELSRLNADALRDLLSQLRSEAAVSSYALSPRSMASSLRQLMKDSPRLDILDVSLESPMLGASLNGSGVLVFDAGDLKSLNPLNLTAEAEQDRWRRHLDGDFLWDDLPPVVALWLGLPLGTHDLQIDVVRGKLRINGRPLPRVLHWLQ